MAEVIYHKEPIKLLGKSLEIYLKDGGAFLFRVTEAGANYIRGYDDEGMNLHVDITDISYLREV